MKIAIFTDVFLEVPGGIPSSIAAQKKSLEQLGHSVTVFCPGWLANGGKASSNTTGDPTIIMVPTHGRWLKLNDAPVSQAPGKVVAWVEQQMDFSQFDLVHVHYEASCSLAGMLLARKHQIPLVQTMHGREDMAIAINVPHPFKTLVAAVLCWLHSKYIPHKVRVYKDHYLAPTRARAKMWELMVSHANFADRVITPSVHFAKKLEYYGVEKKLSAVSNGVADADVAAYERLAKRGKKGQQNALLRQMAPDEPLRILWNSRVSREKRMLPFLEGLKMLERPYLLTVLGDGNELAAAQQYAIEHNIKARFYGQVPHAEVLKHLRGQHISATVSYGFDTQGLTLLEAEAVGLPVFFCDQDMREVVPRAGAVIAAGPSPAAMAEALEAIKPAKIAKMSQAMLDHRTEVLQSTQIQKLLKVYEGLHKA